MEKERAAAAGPEAEVRAKTKRHYGYEFYRNNFRRMTVLAMGLVILDVVIVLAMVAVFRTQPEQELYATTRNGLLVHLRQFESVPQIQAFQKAKAAKTSAANQ